MARDLLLGAFNSGSGEVINKELVPPSTAASRVGCPRGIPIVMQAWTQVRYSGGCWTGRSRLEQRLFQRPLTKLRLLLTSTTFYASVGASACWRERQW